MHTVFYEGTRFILQKELSLLFILFLFLSGFQVWAQTRISGQVIDPAGNPLPGSNIYLLNTLDGASTDENGQFTFISQEQGEQLLIISSLGYASQQKMVQLEGKALSFEIILKETSGRLNEVVVTAGMMEASNEREVAMLRPIDIATTAGVGADIASAIQTLPGTQRVSDQTGLFVRGGDASETLTIIDGMVVQNAFLSSVPGVAQRSRFSPFQFKGIAFSSGGYSARYGQALSSVLELSTLDLTEESTFSAGINMAGVSAAATKRWTQSGLELTADYTNLSPFYGLIPANFDFYDVPEGGGGAARWVWKNQQDGILKMAGNYGFYRSGIEIPDPRSVGERIDFGLKNRNLYFNSSYRQPFGKDWYLFTALSFSDNEDKTLWDELPSNRNDWRLQFRAETAYAFSESFNLLTGVELQRFNFKQTYDTLTWHYDEAQLSTYAEADWKPASWLAIKSGLRVEHSRLLQQTKAGPRLSAGLKTSQFSQISVAGGIYYQNPDNTYLLQGYRPDIQQATHYIANYQWMKELRSFRVEAYYKGYNDLIKEKGSQYNPNPYRFISGKVDNSGEGYAKGIDIFWRDKALVKNLDYWISYSLIDSERLYANLLSQATPPFISRHNLNVIGKYFIESIRLNVSASYNYASGKPYYMPEQSAFLRSTSPAYHHLSLNLSYLTTIGKMFSVFYLGVDNITNRKNIFGYRYAEDGQDRYPIEPALYRSFFAGLAISLSAFDQDEL